MDSSQKKSARLQFSKTEFAEICGVKRLAQGNYENDKRSPDATYLIAAAKLGIDVNYLITGVRISPVTSLFGTINNADEAQLLTEYRESSDAARGAARYILRKMSGKAR